jgi:diaminopimelate decarboxylase
MPRAASPHVTPVGLACHIGSQITDLTPLRSRLPPAAVLTEELRARGQTVSASIWAAAWACPTSAATTPNRPRRPTMWPWRRGCWTGLDVEAAFEPGRLLAANAGVLLSRVIQITERADGRNASWCSTRP